MCLQQWQIHRIYMYVFCVCHSFSLFVCGIVVDSKKNVILTHWGRVTHICVGKQTSIGSNNGLAPDRRQATIWINAGILLIGPLGTNLSEILIEFLTFSFKKNAFESVVCETAAILSRPRCVNQKSQLTILMHYGNCKQQLEDLCQKRNEIWSQDIYRLRYLISLDLNVSITAR